VVEGCCSNQLQGAVQLRSRRHTFFHLPCQTRGLLQQACQTFLAQSQLLMTVACCLVRRHDRNKYARCQLDYEHTFRNRKTLVHMRPPKIIRLERPPVNIHSRHAICCVKHPPRGVGRWRVLSSRPRSPRLIALLDVKRSVCSREVLLSCSATRGSMQRPRKEQAEQQAGHAQQRLRRILVRGQ